ncbi:hypothetical protein QN277_024907 [Acacia crassicarpa]|uniref:Uncharacterized protein n=1 Tax=Acacia crassicarpa TaxID=499986 RepID=A0AAE1JD88_9FABA|nr:hypothetical protein QN277_024907 [Acacia crassicarpa]
MDEDFDMPPPEEMSEDFDLLVDDATLKVGDEKEIGKQGLKKKLLKEGEGWDTPEVGDEIEGSIVISFVENDVLGYSHFL